MLPEKRLQVLRGLYLTLTGSLDVDVVVICIRTDTPVLPGHPTYNTHCQHWCQEVTQSTVNYWSMLVYIQSTINQTLLAAIPYFFYTN